MRLRDLPSLVEDDDRLDGPAGAVAGAVRALVAAGPLKDALSGTWLGHAVHPMLTDLPIGFWTSAFVLDLVGGRRARGAADRLIALGIASAVPAAVTGLSDFADTSGRSRRVGLVHASANTAALLLYAASWRARRRGKRARGVALGMAGAAAATVGGYLGGHLVNALGVGVDNTTFERGPSEWTDAGPAPRLGDGEAVAVRAGEVTVLVARHDGALVALSDRCVHRGGPLHEGTVSGGCVTCPWHGSTFRLDDGDVVRGPAAQAQPRYEARERDGRLEVRAG